MFLTTNLIDWTYLQMTTNRLDYKLIG